MHLCEKSNSLIFLFIDSLAKYVLLTNHMIVQFREWSFLILGTRVEDNFAQLEKISYPILKIETILELRLVPSGVLAPPLTTGHGRASLHFSGPAFKISTLCVMVKGLGSELCFGNGALGLVRRIS